MFDQLPEGKDFLEVNSSRPLLPPSTFIPRTNNKADEMLPVLLCCPLLAASTTSNTSSPSPTKMKPHSFTLIAFCFGHAQTPPRPPPPFTSSPRFISTWAFQRSIILKWFPAEMERANVLQSLLLPTGFYPGSASLGSARWRLRKIKVQRFLGSRFLWMELPLKLSPPHILTFLFRYAIYTSWDLGMQKKAKKWMYISTITFESSHTTGIVPK